MSWITGGPFYELSLLIFNNIDRKAFLHSIIDQLSKSNYAVEVVEHDSEIELKIAAYAKGEPFKNKIIRNAKFNLWVKVAGKRRAILFIAELSDELIKINFWFYGENKAVDPKGISKKDQLIFRLFLIHLIKIYQPLAAVIGYLKDIEALFELKDGYPNNI